MPRDFSQCVEMAARARQFDGLGDVGAARRSRAPPAVDGLDVLSVGADIADMREGEGDDLAGIGGIGEDLLDSRSCEVLKQTFADRPARWRRRRVAPEHACRRPEPAPP